jgi:hypothetical protein
MSEDRPESVGPGAGGDDTRPGQDPEGQSQRRWRRRWRMGVGVPGGSRLERLELDRGVFQNRVSMESKTDLTL